MRARIASTLLLALTLNLAGCSTGGASPSGTLTVTDAWARPSMGMELAGAAYLTITNGTGQADALVGASTPAATTTEIHETSADASGMMGMHPVDRVEVPPGGTATLEPGGYHLMLIGLTGELAPGATIEITLTFEHAGTIVVQAEVRAS